MQIRFYLMVGPGYTGLDPDQATRIQNFDLSMISDTACPKSHAHLYIATHVIKGTILFGYTVYRDDTLKRRYIVHNYTFCFKGSLKSDSATPRRCCIIQFGKFKF